MKFVYTTDLHGNISSYENVLNFAEEHEINLIHLGADLLPKGPGMKKQQKKFIKGFLNTFYQRWLSRQRYKTINVLWK